MKITVLGCGASAGVPLIGCRCKVCRSANPKNKRTRASIVIEQGAERLLVDMSPDLRHQALREDLNEISGVYVTHFHADHCHGIDDMRSFNFAIDRVLPLYADADTLQGLQTSFRYAFQERSASSGWYRPAFALHEVHHAQAFQHGSLEVMPFEQHHGGVKSYGLRVGSFAYSTDVKSFPEKSQPYLQNLDLWIVDCLSLVEKPTHAHLDLVLEWIEHYRPKRAVLTHMSHELDYDLLKRQLPANVDPAFDGAVFHL